MVFTGGCESTPCTPPVYGPGTSVDLSCGTVALMVLGQFSDIWSANIRKLAKDHKSYGSAAM